MVSEVDRMVSIETAIEYLLHTLEGTNFETDKLREGLRETPARAARYWRKVTEGYQTKPADIMKVFEDGADKVDQMVFQGNIPFFSQCEHHLVPFFGVAHMAYIPGKPEFVPTHVSVVAHPPPGWSRGQKILGLSKFARLLDIYTRRLQVQERIGTQVADAMMENLKPQGAAIVIRARHLCMECRGVEKIGAVTMTSTLRGAFMEDPTVRAEFMQFVAMAENRSPNI